MPQPNAVRHDAVRAQLDRILLSPGFTGSPRLCGLLRYLIEQTLNGTATDIKEYSIGLEVFGLPSSFDPKEKSIVRSTAGKLREKLAEYYQSAGQSDPIVIDIPKGAYVPRFRAVRKSAARWVWPVAAAAALVVVALGALGWRSAIPDRHPSVAVLDVRNASETNRDAWLSTALAEMITDDLSGAEGLRTVPTEEIAQWRRDLRQPDVRIQVGQHGPQLQDRLGAGYAVLADFRASGDGVPTLQVATRLQRLRDGKTLLRAVDNGSEAQLYALTGQIAQRIRRALGIAQGEEASRHGGPDRESMRLYSEALVKLGESDPLGARGLLENSVRGDPSNLFARSTLAETYLALGMEERAKIEAREALMSAAALPPTERLALEARCQRAMNDLSSAIGSYRKLWSRFPEGIDYGLNLADLQEKSGLQSEALQTIMKLRSQHPSPADEARIEYAEALIHGMSGENQNGLVAIRQCENKAKRLGARYLYARARLREGGLLMNLMAPGRFEAVDDALVICREQGYRDCQMNALRVEGNLFASSDARRALDLYGQGVDIARQLGSPGGLLQLLRGLGFVAFHQLLDQEAEARDREAIAVVSDQDRRRGSLEMDLAILLTFEGRLAEADRILRPLGAGFEHDFTWNLCMAQLERTRGEYGPAARRIESALVAARKSDGRGNLIVVLEQAFLLHREQGDLPRATADVQELERSRTAVALTPYLQADLALSRETWDEAAAQAAAAQKLYLAEAHLAGSVAAAVLRAEALTGAGRAADALQALDEIAPALDHSRRVPLQIRARACRFRAQALLNSCPDGAQVQALVGAAQALGIPSLFSDVNAAARQVRGRCRPAVYAIAGQAGTRVLH